MRAVALMLFLTVSLGLPALAESGGKVQGVVAPLGQVVEIEGQVIDGSTTKMRQYEGVQLLEVRSVGGKKLEAPKRLRFHWHSLAKSADLKGQVKLAGYESGEYTGIPDKAFDYVPRAASTGFQFESHFILLKLLK